MSTTIDEKVVEMRFDNKDFEKNVKTSMNTISSLKKSLDFDESAKSFNNLEKAAKKVKFEGITDAIETVKVKFSYLQMAVARVFTNIVDDAYYAGKRLAKSLSVDQITAGWDKYAQKTSSVQTIMAATAKDFEDTGEQMEYVNEQLEKLNWFTDETSYNFLDMVNNIGKFTSNNVKLEDAVTAMQGISNWAAISGANVGEASRAMYNLSQSMAMGEVKLMDWRSIENANMATYEFKQQVVDTAVKLKTVTKVGKDLYAVGDKTYSLLELFSNGLQKHWFTSDVLIKTLKNYGEFTNKLYEATEETELTATELLQAIDDYKEGTLNLDEFARDAGVNVSTLSTYLNELSKDTYEVGRRAFKAAQEAKTFQEAIDAVKDAVSTGWMNTFEYIFGDYQTAKKVWTTVANELYDVFAESGNARNELLRLWALLGGRDQLFQGVANVWENLKKIIGAVKDGIRDIFPPATAGTLLRITKGFRDLTERLTASDEELDKIRRTFRGFAAVLDIARSFLFAVWNEVKNVFSYFQALGGGLLDTTANLGDFLVKVRNWIKDNQIFEKGIRNVVNAVKFLAGAFDNLMRKITGYGVVELVDKLVDNLKYFYDEMSLIIKLLFGKNTPKQLSELIKQFKDLTGIDFKDSKLFNFFLRTKAIFAGLKNLVADLIHGESFKDAIQQFFGSAFGSDAGGKIFEFLEKIGDAFKKAWDKVSESINKFKGGFDDFSEIVKKRWDKIKKSFADAKKVIVESWEKIKEVISEASGKDLNEMNKLGTVISVILYPIQLLFTGLTYLFKGLGMILDNFGPTIVEFIKKIAKGLLDLGKVLKDSFLGANFSKFLDLITSGSLAIIFGKLAASLLGVSKAGEGLKSLGEVNGKFSFLEFLKNLYTYSKKMGKTISETFQNILGGVCDVLKAWQRDLQANVLLKLAAAIGILAVSLVILSSLDYDKLTYAIGAISTLFAELIGAFKLLTSGMGTVEVIAGGNAPGKGGLLGSLIGNFQSALGEYSQLAALILSIAGALVVMSVALKMVSSLEPKKLATGLIGITILLGELLVFIKVLQKNEKAADVGIKGMVKLALGLYIMATSVKKLAKLDVTSMLQGIAGIGLILLMLVGFIKLLGTHLKSSSTAISTETKSYETLTEIASGLVILAVALKMMVTAVKKLGKMEFKQLEQGLFAFGIILAVVAGFVYLLRYEMPKGDNKAEVGLMRVANMMLVMSVAMTIMAGALRIIGGMDFEHASVALIGFAGTIGIIILAFDNLKDEHWADLLKVSGAILLFANAFVILALAMKIMASVEGKGMLKSALALTYIFGIVSIFSAFTQGDTALKAAGAMLLIANAMLVLAPALMLISMLDAGGIIAIITTLTSVLFVLGLFTDLMAGSELTLLAVSGSFALVGVGLLALGAGFTVLAAGLVALGASLPILGEFLVLMIKLIPKLILSVFEGLFEAILEFGTKILVAVLESINAIIGPTIKLLFNFIDTLLKALNDHLPSIVQNLIDLALKLIELVRKSAFKIVDKLLNLVMDLAEALGKAFRKNSARLVQVIAGLIKNILVGALNMVAPWLVKLLGLELEDVTDAFEKLTDEEKEAIEGIDDLAESYKEMDKTRRDNYAKIQNEQKYISDLKDEYNNLIDSEGHVKAGYEERAETIKTLLAEAMDIGVDQIEKMIGANGRLEASFDGVITKMRLQAYIEANKDAYNQAIQNESKAYEAYITKLDEVNKLEEEAASIRRKKFKYQSIVGYWVGLGRTDNAEAQQAAFNLGQADEELKEVEEKLKIYHNSLNTAEETYYNTLKDRNRYEKMVQEYNYGDVKGMEKVVKDVNDDFLRAGDASTKQLKDQIAYWEGKVTDYERLEKSGYDVAKELENARTRVGEAWGELVKDEQGYKDSWKSTSKQATKAGSEGIDEGKEDLVSSTEDTVTAMLEKYGILPEAMGKINLKGLDITKLDLGHLEELCAEGGGDSVFAYLSSFDEAVDSGEEKVEKTIEKTVTNATDKAKKNAKDEGNKLGDAFVEGILEGMESNRDKMDKYTWGSAEHFIKIYAKEWGVASPSKVMFKMGSFFMQGLINGIKSLQDTLYETADDTSLTTVDTLSETMSRVSDIFSSDLDVDPTIRPVMDLSGVTSGVNTINGMFGSQNSLRLAGSINRDSNLVITDKLQNGLTVNNKDVVGELDKLRTDLNRLNNNVSNLKVVMDTGALVGQIARPIDNTLGKWAMNKRRGV